MRHRDDIVDGIVKYLDCLSGDPYPITLFFDAYADNPAEERVVANIIKCLEDDGIIRIISIGNRSKAEDGELDRLNAAFDRDPNDTWYLVELV